MTHMHNTDTQTHRHFRQEEKENLFKGLVCQDLCKGRLTAKHALEEREEKNNPTGRKEKRRKGMKDKPCQYI